MNFLNKIYVWILNNYIKLITFFLIIASLYGIYLYFYFAEQKKDQNAGDLFLNFYNSYSSSEFSEQEYNLTLDEISKIDNSSIYLAMLKSIYAAQSVENSDLQTALTELSNAKEILVNKGDDFNFLREIIDIRMVNIFIHLEDLERAKNILKNTFKTYQINKLILQGDILAIEKKSDEAKQKYLKALQRSENDTQKNFINLKISNLIE